MITSANLARSRTTAAFGALAALTLCLVLLVGPSAAQERGAEPVPGRNAATQATDIASSEDMMRLADRAELAIARAEDASRDADRVISNNDWLIAGLALVVFIGVAGIGVFSVWQTVNARREAREVLSDARLYLDEIVRLRDKAQKDAGNASTSATAAETARDAVGARIVVVDEAAHRLATVIADGIVGAFSLWMGLAEFHRRTDRPDAAISAMDGAARLVEESKVQNVHFCDYLAATYDSLGASDKALDWVNKAMELTKGRRPHEHFLRGTVHLNHRRPVADATLRQQDFVDAEAEFTQALELQSEVEPGEKLDDLVLGKTYLFRGKARLLRAKQAAGEEPPRLLRLAREDCDQAKGTLLGLKEANPAMAPEAERWLTEVDRCIAEIND